MSEGCGPTVKNIKISFKIKNTQYSPKVDSLGKKKESYIIEHRNFIVIRKKFVYVAFSSGFINVSGIKNDSEVLESIANFAGILNTSPRLFEDYTIDNITASGSFADKVNLSELSIKNCDKSGLKIRYKPVYFPGAFIKSYPTGGTLIVFSSGKYTIVGVKSLREAVRIYEKAKKFIENTCNDFRKRGISV